MFAKDWQDYKSGLKLAVSFRELAKVKT